MLKEAKRILLTFLVVALILPLNFSLVRATSIQKIDESFLRIANLSDDYFDIIVQLEKQPLVEYKNSYKTLSLSDSQYLETLQDDQENFINKTKKEIESFEVLHTYNNVYNGVALRVKGKDVTKILEISGIKKVHEPKYLYPQLSTSVPLIGAPDIWKMKTPTGTLADGTGGIIGIIDTGIDYNHPDLGGPGFPNTKVIGGYDFAHDDPDPMDKEGHGTHVAGIAAADGKLKGVAPKAKLMAYKVFKDEGGGASEADIVKAIDKSVLDKCTAINMSLGSDSGRAVADNPEIIASNNASNAGVIVVAAAGNSSSRNPKKAFPIHQPSTALKAISVAATDDGPHGLIKVVEPKGYEKEILGNYADVSPEFQQGVSFEVVECGYGRGEDFIGKDVKGKIALVLRGPLGESGVYFRDKDLNAKEAGAIGVIIYNHSPGMVGMTFLVEEGDENREYIPALFITEGDGYYLKNLLVKGLKLQFGIKTALSTMATFSSMGPTPDFYFKPEVAAPGVAIESTMPGGKYARLQGTSMASPHVAGAVTLVKLMHPDWTPEMIKASLMNTAKVLTNYQNDRVITWQLQGAGRIYIPDAVNIPAITSPTSLLLNEEQIKTSPEIQVKNLTNNNVSFNLTFLWTSKYNDGISVKLSSSSINVSGKGTASFKITVSVDSTKAEKGPHEGIIYLKSETATLHIPFIYWQGTVEPPEPLSHVSIEKDEFSPNSDGKDDTLTFNFSIGYGALMMPTEENDKPEASNIVDSCEISITKLDGTLLGYIYKQSLLLVGDYVFKWDGKDLNGNNFLSDGTYMYKVVLVESNKSNQDLKITDAAVKTGTFKVTGMNVPRFSFVSPQEEIIQNQQFSISLNVESPVNINSVNGTLTFDPAFFEIQEIKEGDFFKTGGASTTFTSKFDNTSGTIEFSVSRAGSDTKGSGVLLNILLTPKKSGAGLISFKNILVKDLKGTKINPIVSLGNFAVKEPARPWDMNNDKKVDGKDLLIFAQAFGSKTGDSNYNPLADFNKDGKVDGQDLIILASHFGETYP